MTKLLCFDPKKNKEVLVGHIDGDTLRRNVSSKHFMRVLQGYGIQEVAFQELVERGVKRIVLNESATGVLWAATTDMWMQNSKIADYGNGKQRFLSLKFMIRVAA